MIDADSTSAVAQATNFTVAVIFVDAGTTVDVVVVIVVRTVRGGRVSTNDWPAVRCFTRFREQVRGR